MTASRWMNPSIVALCLALMAVCAVPAQQPNTSGGPGTASMTFNSIAGPPYPIAATIVPPTTLTIQIDASAASVPFAMFQSTTTVGAITTPGFQIVDLTLGTLQVVMDGTTPTTPPLWNALAVLDAAGSFGISLPINFNVAMATPLGTFQTLVFDPAGPDGFTLTAATEVTLDGIPNYGTIKYGSGGNTSSHQGVVSTSPGPAVNWPGFPASLDVEVMSLAGFQMWDNIASHPWWRRDLNTLPISAMTQKESSSFNHQKTLFGDLYCYQDNDAATDTFGFFLCTPGSSPQILSDTIVTGTGSTGTSQPYETEIAIQGNLMLAVVDRSTSDPVSPGQPDQAFLYALDGSTFASSGTGAVNVTPTVSPPVSIPEESLTITNNGWLFFVGSDGSTTAGNGRLFAAPTNGSAPATEVVIPNLTATGMAPTLVDGEMIYSEDRQVVLFQAGAGSPTTSSPTTEDVYLIRDITPAGFNVVNISRNASATQVEEFGDSSDGFDGQGAVSPGNANVAWINRETGPSRDELYVAPADASMPAVQVSTDANFAASVDDILSLTWADDDNLHFFAGTSTTATDLYRYQLSTTTVTNLTQTGGVTSAPFSGGSIQADEQFFNLDRSKWYFMRDGGLDGSNNATRNLIGVDLTTFALSDVTGSEFASGTAPDTDGFSATSPHISFAPTGNTVAFVQERSTGTDDEIFSFDAQAASAAVQLSSHNGSAFITVDNPAIRGGQVLFSSNVNGQDEIFLADLGVMGASVVFPSPTASSGDITDGCIRWHPTLDQLYVAYGSNSGANPTDAQLYWLDLNTMVSFVIDSTPASYYIYFP